MDSANRNMYGSTSWGLLAGLAGTFIAAGALASRGMRHPDPLDRELGEGHGLRFRRRPQPRVDRATMVAQGLNQGLKGLWDVAVGGADLVRKEAKMVGGNGQRARQLSGTLRSSGSSLRGLSGTLGHGVGKTATTLGSTLGTTLGQTTGAVSHTAGAVGSKASSLTSAAGHTVGTGVNTVTSTVGHGVGTVGSFVRTTLSLLFWIGLAGTVLFYLYVPETRRRERVVSQVRGWLDRNPQQM
ncbi:MAG: hypothetical protein ACYC4L_15185 [Chloroflexota bacterium]